MSKILRLLNLQYGEEFIVSDYPKVGTFKFMKTDKRIYLTNQYDRENEIFIGWQLMILDLIENPELIERLER